MDCIHLFIYIYIWIYANTRIYIYIYYKYILCQLVFSSNLHKLSLLNLKAFGGVIKEKYIRII